METFTKGRRFTIFLHSICFVGLAIPHPWNVPVAFRGDTHSYVTRVENSSSKRSFHLEPGWPSCQEKQYRSHINQPGDREKITEFLRQPKEGMSAEHTYTGQTTEGKNLLVSSKPHSVMA